MHGQGKTTVLKESAFRGIFWMNLAVQKKSSFRYHHFDLNSGCGYNHEVGCEGSPLVFLNVADAQSVSNFSAHFVDRDREAIKELLTRIEGRPGCTAYNGENREFVKAIPDLIRLDHGNPAKALGTVLCDPNGIDLPLNELAQLARICPRLDFVINYPARVWKRARGAGIQSAQLYLAELLHSLDKQHWIIQEPLGCDIHEFMILVGRNFEFKNWSRMRFHKLDSPKAGEIIQRSFSRNESTLNLF
jgi:three-Cys-motif partner protein